MCQKERGFIMPPISLRIQGIQYPHGPWTGTETSIKPGRTVQYGRRNEHKLHSRIKRRDYSLRLFSEPYLRLSPHTAQAFLTLYIGQQLFVMVSVSGFFTLSRKLCTSALLLTHIPVRLPQTEGVARWQFMG